MKSNGNVAHVIAIEAAVICVGICEMLLKYEQKSLGLLKETALNSRSHCEIERFHSSHVGRKRARVRRPVS